MEWRKLGRIWAPGGQHPWIWSHAAVPIAQHLEADRYRIYFSSRDAQNRSQTGYLDVNLREPSKILALGSAPVLRFGEPGTFDDSGAMASWITANGDEQYLYYIGWNLGVTVPFRNSIGLAISRDNGQSFAKYSKGPLLDRTPVDPYFLASSCVLRQEDVWRMWYLSCVGWEFEQGKPRHRYHIRYAESRDGLNWIREGRVCIDFNSDAEYAISRPSVLYEGGIYRMWYSHRGIRYRIGYAESEDGLTWQRKDGQAGIDVSATGWDSEMIEYPFVFSHNGTQYMLYNGNDYGRTGIGLAVSDSPKLNASVQS